MLRELELMGFLLLLMILLIFVRLNCSKVLESRLLFLLGSQQRWEMLDQETLKEIHEVKVNICRFGFEVLHIVGKLGFCG